MDAVKNGRAGVVNETSSPRAQDPLAALGEAIRACRLCVESPLGARLPHPPNPIVRLSATARLCIASQAAGTRAHASSIPFDDASGDRLRTWLALSREEFYDMRRVAIVPMGFCFPGQDSRGGDLPPRRECSPAWRAQVFAAMPQLELILAIGQYAQAWHCAEPKPRGLTERVADWRASLADAARPRVIALPHPSWRNNGWLKQNPWFEAEFLPLLRRHVGELIAPRRVERHSNSRASASVR